MSDELKSNIWTRENVPLAHALLKEPMKFPDATMNHNINLSLTLGVYSSQENTPQQTVAIGAVKDQNGRWCSLSRTSVREEGTLKYFATGVLSFGGAVVSHSIFTVPIGKLWVVKAVNSIWSGTATIANTNFYIVDPSGNQFLLKTVVPPTKDITYSLENYWFGGTLTLPEGWALQVDINDTLDTSGVYNNKIIYLEIDA